MLCINSGLVLLVNNMGGAVVISGASQQEGSGFKSSLSLQVPHRYTGFLSQSKNMQWVMLTGDWLIGDWLID